MVRVLHSDEDNITIAINGRIDSVIAKRFEDEVFDIIFGHSDVPVVFDAKDLEYMSSAGLRVLLRLKKLHPAGISIRNVQPSVYEILEMTGFTGLFPVEKTFRRIEVSHAEALGKSVNGRTFALPGDEMVKIYKKGVPLSEIQLERTLARKAMQLGVPTIIPYDVVLCGDDGYYGIVFEKLKAKTLAKAIADKPERTDEYATLLGDCVRDMHDIIIDDDEIPCIGARYEKWIEKADYLDAEGKDKLRQAVRALSPGNHYVHGDIRLENILVYEDELIFADMAASGQGSPIYDLQGLYSSLVRTEKERPFFASTAYGLSAKTCERLWNVFLEIYTEGDAPEVREELEEKIQKGYVITKWLNDSLSSAH